MDERQALIAAARATNDIGGDESRAPAFRRVDEELQRGGSIWDWFSGITNFGDMREDIRRMSRALVRAGMTPDAAVRLAGEDVRSQYTNINGYMVRTGDRHVEAYGTLLRGANLQPRTFADSVTRYLEEYARENPAVADMITRPDPTTGEEVTMPQRRLSIAPQTDGVGTWAIIDATTGLPVSPGPNGGRQTITMRDLVDFERRTQTEAGTAEARRLAAEAERERRRALEEAERTPPPPPLGGWPDDTP
jgi:hypothetical protein